MGREKGWIGWHRQMLCTVLAGVMALAAGCGSISESGVSVKGALSLIKGPEPPEEAAGAAEAGGANAASGEGTPSGAAGVSAGAEGTSGTAGEDTGTAKTLRLINSKSEVDQPLKDLAAAYEAKTGTKVLVESTAAGADAQALLKGYYLSDNMPDIFACEAAGFASWDGLVADLSGEPWVSDTDASYADPESGAVLGFPYSTEAIGLAYNAGILEKAGIDPASLTGPKQFREAFQKLNKMKKKLGLTAVSGYCAEDQNLYWSTGNHLFGVYLDEGLARDDTTYLDLINSSQKLDPDRALHFAQFVGLLQSYADPKLLTDGTYDDQVRNFAAGKYAFIPQGSWIGAMMTGVDADAYEQAGNFGVGMVPYAFEDGMDTILTNSPSWWAVSKEGNVDEAKDFLNFCAGDEGQKILAEEAGFVSPFRSSTTVGSDPFAPVIREYLANGKTSSWHWMELKEGIAKNALGTVFSQYARSKKMSAKGFTYALQEAIRKYYNKAEEDAQ